MSRWMKALAKAGLVELTPEERERIAGGAPEGADSAEIDRILAESKALTESAGDTEPAVPGETAAPVAAEPAAPVEPLVDVAANVDLSALYTRLAVESTPYAAEKLLVILDAMRALDPAARKAAILAMDSAEPSWTIADPLLDADRKIQALQTAQRELDATVTDAEAKGAADLAAQDEYKNKASAEIRQQIADLEALLAQELQNVADNKADINVRLAETRSVCTQERARYDAEIDRLKTLNIIFSSEA